MTDSSILTTQNAVSLLTTSLPSSASAAAHPPPSPAVLTNGHAHLQDDLDAEEGAIKCICSNPDDDGNTVMCDKCETWQHIICYYVDRDSLDDDDPHFCVDCEPRYLDAKAADERQKATRVPQVEVPVPRRPKTAAKPKKKSSKSDGSNHTNGLVNGHGSPRNGENSSNGVGSINGGSGKRKGRHQSSASMSNIPIKIPTKRPSHSHAQSPIKSPHSPPLPSDPNKAFSPDFMQLYKTDSGEDSMAVSQFEAIDVPARLGDWVRNADALAQDTNGKTHGDIFTRTRGPVSDMPQVPWAKHRKEDRSIVAHGFNPQWIYITAEKDVGRESFVGELIGKIGFMQSYTQDQANRWEYLRHPLPFVFFHPQLPIVIDTREEGSVFRYLRRSCDPNLTMRTFLDEVQDYHFCFMANRETKAGTELTIPWTLDEHVRRFVVKPNEADVDEEYVSNYIRRLLAEFGGCACNDPSTCTMARRAGWTSVSQKSSKSRKKPRNGFGSRSSSEALKQADEDDEEDGTAASTSSRSKPQSRDNTPSSMVDTKNILGEPISEREKRKIEALERSEQGRQPNPKKPKRKSADGRYANAPPTPGLAKRNSIPEKDPYSPGAEAATSSRAGLTSSPSPPQIAATTTASAPISSSAPPPATHSTTPLTKPVYSEVGCQADLDCTSLSRSLPSPTRTFMKRPMSSLHRRVFRRSILKSDTESPKASPLASPDAEKTDVLVDGTQSEPPQLPHSASKDTEGDVHMSDGQETGLGIEGVQLDADGPPEQKAEKPETDLHVDPKITADDEGKRTSIPVASPVEDQKVKSEKKDEEGTPSTPSVNVESKPTINRPSKPVVETSNLNPAEKASPERPHPTLAPHLAREADAAATATPSPARKKKINLSQYLARRNSSNVSNSENDGDAGKDGLSAKTSDDAIRSLSPLREEARENGDEGVALETPKTENGDPMVMT